MTSPAPDLSALHDLRARFPERAESLDRIIERANYLGWIQAGAPRLWGFEAAYGITDADILRACPGESLEEIDARLCDCYDTEEQ